MTLTKIPGGIIADSTITSADILDSTITNAKLAVDPANASNLSSGDVPLAQLDNVPAANLSPVLDDIALLAFKTQANGNLARYNLVDQSVDAFEDATGVNSGASSDAIRDSSGKYYSGSQAGNYFGDGTLGDCQFTSSTITQSDNTTAINTVLARGSTSGPVASNYGWTNGMKNVADDANYSDYYEATVANGTASFTSGSGATDGNSINGDGDMVVLNFKDLTIDQGVCLTPTHPCRGMLVYVNGNCVINGGLSMSSRGAWADPTASGAGDSSAVSATGVRLPLLTSGGTDTLAAADFAGTGTASVAAVANQTAISGNGTIITISRTGSNGGSGSTAGYNVLGGDGTDGTAGVTLSTGGGGGGGCHNASGFTTPAGRSGTIFSGGTGGGGSRGTQGVIGEVNGGQGGKGIGGSAAETTGGGAGNPAGARRWGGVEQGNGSADGTGGLLILLVNGNLTLGSNGQIDATGQLSQSTGGGGQSGGGTMLIGYAGTLTNNGLIKIYNVQEGGTNRGGIGGDAGLYNAQISAGEANNNMTLVSNSITAQSAPTKGDLVFTYTNGVGTAVLGTNITAEASMDAGVTWTNFSIGASDSQGTTGGHTIVTKNNVTLTSTSGTAMRYRIKTLVQSAAMDTRIHAVSLGWS